MKKMNNCKFGFTISELLVSMLIAMVVAAAMVPVIGPKKITQGHKRNNHGIMECYYDANKKKIQGYYINRGIENKVTRTGTYCVFDLPKDVDQFQIYTIGRGGTITKTGEPNPYNVTGGTPESTNISPYPDDTTSELPSWSKQWSKFDADIIKNTSRGASDLFDKWANKLQKQTATGLTPLQKDLFVEFNMTPPVEAGGGSYTTFHRVPYDSSKNFNQNWKAAKLCDQHCNFEEGSDHSLKMNYECREKTSKTTVDGKSKINTYSNNEDAKKAVNNANNSVNASTTDFNKVKVCWYAKTTAGTDSGNGFKSASNRLFLHPILTSYGIDNSLGLSGAWKDVNSDKDDYNQDNQDRYVLVKVNQDELKFDGGGHKGRNGNETPYATPNSVPMLTYGPNYICYNSSDKKVCADQPPTSTGSVNVNSNKSNKWFQNNFKYFYNSGDNQSQYDFPSYDTTDGYKPFLYHSNKYLTQKKGDIEYKTDAFTINYVNKSKIKFYYAKSGGSGGYNHIAKELTPGKYQLYPASPSRDTSYIFYPKKAKQEHKATQGTNVTSFSSEEYDIEDSETLLPKKEIIQATIYDNTNGTLINDLYDLIDYYGRTYGYTKGLYGCRQNKTYACPGFGSTGIYPVFRHIPYNNYIEIINNQNYTNGIKKNDTVAKETPSGEGYTDTYKYKSATRTFAGGAKTYTDQDIKDGKLKCDDDSIPQKGSKEIQDNSSNTGYMMYYCKQGKKQGYGAIVIIW